MAADLNNFAFLQNKWPLLANLASQAEKFAHDEPNVALIKIRQPIESFNKSALERKVLRI